MLDSMIRRVVLVCLFSRWNSVDAWTLESPSRRPFLQHRRDATLFASTTDDETTSISRRSAFKLVSTIAAGLTTLPSFVGAEVDPFAAMDDMLSSGAAGPGNSSNNNNNNNSGSKPSSDANKAPSNPSSDITAALKESKQRKNVAPRTHG